MLNKFNDFNSPLFWKQKKTFNIRTNVALVVVFICFAILIGRMSYLQIIDYKHYNAMAEGNRISIEVLPPARGKIYDRNNIVLADNKPAYALKFTRERNIDLIKLTLKLKNILPNIKNKYITKFIKKIYKTGYYSQVISSFSITEKQAAKIAVNSHQLPGVSLIAKLKRIYPFKSTAVHAIGYVGHINSEEIKSLDPALYKGTYYLGKTGIEQFYEDKLHGIPGLQYVETNARGHVTRKLNAIPAKAGEDIQLALDIELQMFSENLLANKKGAIVVMDVNNGEILTYVSQPTYDPNLFVSGMSHKKFQALLNNPNKPFINRVINGQYPPGSTIKPFIALGALEKKIISPNHKISDPGYLEYGNHRYRDWKRRGHGIVDMNAAITQSCDTYFYELGLKMGIDKIHNVLSPFGLGNKTQIDLSNESKGLLPSQQWKKDNKGITWYGGETVIAAIGQGYMLSTPLQLAKATSILASRGQVVIPHLRIRDKLNNTNEQIPINKINNWNTIIKSMVNVLHDPTGTAYGYARKLPFQMAGKTGTAQVFGLKNSSYNPENLKTELLDHSLFVGFVPAIQPKVSIIVIVENSSIKAAILAIKIAKFYMKKTNKDSK